MSRQTTKSTVVVALAACTTSLLAACGSDDKAAASPTSPAAPAATTAAPAATTEAPAATTAAPVATTAAPVATTAPVTEPDGDDPAALATFCGAYSDITISMSGEPDPALLTELIATVDSTAPTEIAAPAGVMTEAVSAVLASQGADFSPLESPEFAEAQGVVDPFVFENCEFSNSVEVTGVDFAFDGLPATMTSGRLALLFTNNGADSHEIVVFRRNDGVTEPFEELLSLPEEEAMAKVTPVGGAFAPSNGSQALLVADVDPGDYIAICFIPQGTSMSADGQMTEGTGEPHFMHGMQQEFTVTG